MASKYKKYFEEMLQTHSVEFAKFEKLHEKYSKREISQDEYNQKGSIIMKIVKEWESKLCAYMEGGKYGSYSANLSDKFMDEVRNKFPLIDFIGVNVKKVQR